MDDATADRLFSELDTNGIVLLPGLVSAGQLEGMRKAFEARLRVMRWNNFDGYHMTELYRHMVEDVLLLDQGFLDVALHPVVKEVLGRYLGNTYELNEAKGWRSLPTRRDFHGWHGDAWYDQSSGEIPRETKLAIYLTDVRSGAFQYVKGTHRRQHPRTVSSEDVGRVPASQIVEVKGPAGSAFLFDTSGTHRQGVPILEPRWAVFYNYHDPHVRLQKEDIDYYRYHPLLLNAAFLGDRSAADQRILGFGNKRNFIPAFERKTRPSWLYIAFCRISAAQLRFRELRERVIARLRRSIRAA